MAKPIVKKIQPFDGTQDYNIEIAWTGNRSYANKLYIYENKTNNLIWEDKITTFSLQHTIPANTLANGNSYVIQASTFDVNDTESALSDKVLFYVFATPNFSFYNLSENVTVASLPVSIYYVSPDLEDISTYNFYLYDSTKKLLLQSESLYDQTDISYVYKGLSNLTDYYIRATGVTENGMELDTGYQLISVKYENPSQYSRIYTTTEPEQGCVQVASNLIIIQYNGTESFEYEDGKINLNDKTLYYDEGFLLEDDFTIILRATNIWQNADILRMRNKEDGLCLSSYIYADDQLRFKLMVPNGIGYYLIYSEPLVFENEDLVTIAIRRKDNVYQIKTFLELNPVTEGSYWYGTGRPASAEDFDIWIDTEGIPTEKVDKETMQTFISEEEPDIAEVGDLWFGI